MTEEETRFRELVNRGVIAALREAGLPVLPEKILEARRRVEGEGAALLEEEIIVPAGRAAAAIRERACYGLGITSSTLHRILGFGAWQARCLGGANATRAGALFNLGIVVFDAILDRGSSAAREELARFSLSDFRDPPRTVAGSTGLTEETSWFLELAQRFFRLLGEEDPSPGLARLLAAEFDSVQPSTAPPCHLVRVLRTKSVEPFLFIALLGDRSPGTTSRTTASVFGRAVWIVDDLWDAAEDLATGGRSRPWLRLGEASRGDATLRAIERSGVLDAELRALGRALSVTGGWPAETRLCLATTLASWVEMPRPQSRFVNV